MQKKRRLPQEKKLTVMIPIRLSDDDHQRFIRTMQDKNFHYASELGRYIVIKYLDKYEIRKNWSKEVDDGE